MDSAADQFVFLFADLAGYTALTVAHGGEGAARVVARYEELAHTALVAPTTLVERVGDELLFVSEEPVSALCTAIALRRLVAGEPLFPTLRAGLHEGPAVERNGRYFGPALNLAARVTARARAGQILCTRPVAEAGAKAGLGSQSHGEMRFKNVPQLVEIFEVVVDHTTGTRRTVDPVCRMQVTADSTTPQVEFHGVKYFFCSASCLAAFLSKPRDHVTGE